MSIKYQFLVGLLLLIIGAVLFVQHLPFSRTLMVSGIMLELIAAARYFLPAKKQD